MASSPSESSAKQRILDATAELFAEAADGDVSTRAICDRAGVTAPTLYHHFGDKDGLLDAVVAKGFEDYISTKRETESTDEPIRDLETGWDTHVAFGLEHPAFYTLMYGRPQRDTTPPAATEARNNLIDLLNRAINDGVIELSAEIAADVVLAANTGVTLALIGRQSDGDDVDLTVSHQLRDAVIAQLAKRGP